MPCLYRSTAAWWERQDQSVAGIKGKCRKCSEPVASDCSSHSLWGILVVSLINTSTEDTVMTPYWHPGREQKQFELRHETMKVHCCPFLLCIWSPHLQIQSSFTTLVLSANLEEHALPGRPPVRRVTALLCRCHYCTQQRSQRYTLMSAENMQACQCTWI